MRRPALTRAEPAAPRRDRGARAWREGHAAEWTAALWLMLRGYQILGFRLPSRAGEIDILARRGGVICVVEVKRRATLDAALQAVTPAQLERLLAAGRAVMRGRRQLSGLNLRIDMVALAPGRFPRHVRGIGSQVRVRTDGPGGV